MASEAGGHAEVLQFELFPSHTMTVCLVEDVENAAELRAEVLQQKFDASFLDAAMVAPGSARTRRVVARPAAVRY
jgi:hypothetical protein